MKWIACMLVMTVCTVTLRAQYDSTAVVEKYSDDEEEPQDEEYFIPKWQEGSAMNPVVLRRLPDSSVEALKKDNSFWYADSVFKRSTARQQQARMQSRQDSAAARRYVRNDYKPVAERSWFQTLLWIIIIGGFVAFMAMYLMSSNVRMFNKKERRIGTGEEDEEPEMDDIFAINYQKEIDRAANGGNYRLAIRLMFLRLLKSLSERNIIQYKHDRTNLDYLMQLSTTNYYKDFFRITRNYEYSWYGKFPVSEDVYKVIKQDFEHFDPTTK